MLKSNLLEVIGLMMEQPLFNTVDYSKEYNTTKKYAEYYHSKYAFNGRSYLDVDDLAQEAIIAIFLKKSHNKKKEIWSSLLDALRKTYVLNRSTYAKVKEGELDRLVPVLSGSGSEDEMLNHTESYDLEDLIHTKQLVEKMLETIPKLKVLPSWNGKRQRLIRAYYFDGLTDEDIAKEFGLSKQCVCLARNKILKALKRMFRNDL